MARYPNLTELAKSSKVDYSEIGSLEAISRNPKSRFEGGYPASISPEWWALRKRYEELLFAKIRKERAASKIKSQVNEPEAEAAKWAALGNEVADRDYKAFVPPAHEVHRRKDWLDAQIASATRRFP